MIRFATLLMVLTVSTLAYSQDGPVGKDVPETAYKEIQRRGNMAQETGTIRSDEHALIADVFGPPPDDSHKWFLTVVTKDGNPVCEKLKSDFITKDALKAWVDVDKPEDSYMHYQVRRVEDETQKDWLAGLKGFIDRGQFPLVVIQPPKNGTYGPSAVVVKVLAGYDGDAAKLSTKLRDSIAFYVSNAKPQTLARHFNQPREESTESTEVQGDIGQIGPPPFPAPKVDPLQPNGPVPDWPAVPSQLSVAQLQQMCPGAPASFIAKLYEQKVSDPAVVQLQYQAWKEENTAPTPAKPAETPVPTPAQPNAAPTVDLPMLVKLLLGSNVVLMLILVGLRAAERWAKGTPSGLDDRIIQYLTMIVEGRLQNLPQNQPAPRNPS